ncbi:hypothetical protein [Nocardia carnea]|uniref:hypothetical protein n=1 Tax=Nocardia carnea TaxID=37328 RepID=UPI0024580A22|nr:hypothetical protein [Nocardia carnea]
MRSTRTAGAGIGALLLTVALLVGCSAGTTDPAPTGQASVGEPVSIRELPLPPTAPSDRAGSCAHPTGCIDGGDRGIAEGPSYTWDAEHVLLPIRYSGAPAAPDPRHVFSGDQVIVIKTDGTTFANGEAWRCLTCGVTDAARANRQQPGSSGAGEILVDHPQAFRDGTRMLIGTNVFDCGTHRLVDTCTPDKATIYPIAPHRPGSIMRELRLHPDDRHLGFSEPSLINGVFVDQFAVVSGLTFNRAAARYELTEVTYLLPNASESQGLIEPVPGEPTRLRRNEPTAMIGEFRGFTHDGKSALGIGTYDSWNFDLFVTDLKTAGSRRVSLDPAYTDPSKTSPDDDWIVYMDGRVSDRLHFAGALPGVPPIVDLVNTGAVQFFYNNGHRRFFQPYIARIDDPGNTRQLNACDDPTPGSGSVCDPLWNGRADPAWSPDGTAIVYWQAMAVPPACGPGQSTAPSCPTSAEPGGRATRLMIAELTDRQPHEPPPVEPFDMDLPWATRAEPGQPLPTRPHLPAGTYTLDGDVSGKATVVVTENAEGTAISRIVVDYDDYSIDGDNVVNGTESATSAPYTWHSDVTLSGTHSGSRSTGRDGFVVTPPSKSGERATLTGELITVIDGRTYTSPRTGE